MPEDYKRRPGVGAYGDQRDFERIISGIPLYSVPVSAGTGQWLENGHEYDFFYLENVPYGTLLHQSGYRFCKSKCNCGERANRRFLPERKGYMKMLQGNKLVSLNKDYPPIVVNEFDSFFCAGRVIGKGACRETDKKVVNLN